MGACQLAIVQYSAKLRGMSACQACSLHSRPVPLYGAQKLCGDIEWHFYTTDLPKALQGELMQGKHVCIWCCLICVHVLQITRNTFMNISSYNKESLGDFAAAVRAWRPPEPYKGKGIRYSDEVVRRKEGKRGK